MSIRKQVPDDWRLVSFGDVAREVSASTRNPIEEGFERYVGLDHLDPDSLSIKRWGLVEEDNPTFTKVFRAGQLLFGRRRSYQRKAAIADFDGICSGDIIVIEAKPELLVPDLLPFIVQSDGFFDYAIRTSAGSLSPRTKWASLAAYQFPLPPLDEQRRIAEILWAEEETHEKFEISLNEIEKLRKRALRQYVLTGVRGTNLRHTLIGMIPEDWRILRIGDAGSVTLGRQRAPQYHSGEFMRPYLRVANVFDGYLDLSDVLEMDFTPDEFETYVLRDGDVLLNEGQSRELVGRSCLFKNEIRGCCFQNTLLRFRVSEGLLPEYAQAYFQTAYYSGVFSAIALQTTSIAHLGAGRFAALYMPIPSLDEQEKIVEILTGIQTARDRLVSHLDTLKIQKDTMIKDLLHPSNSSD